MKDQFSQDLLVNVWHLRDRRGLDRRTVPSSPGRPPIFERQCPETTILCTCLEIDQNPFADLLRCCFRGRTTVSQRDERAHPEVEIKQVPLVIKYKILRRYSNEALDLLWHHFGLLFNDHVGIV